MPMTTIWAWSPPSPKSTANTRVHEIARMLSGSESEASLDHARELLSDSRLTLPLAGAGAAGD